ncbi:MAG: DUF2147 domain-containing protein [Phenylobacterium sp.]
MRRLLLAAAFTLAAAPALAADPVEGDWLTQGGGAKVHIAPCSGKTDRLCGIFTWLKPNQEGKAPVDGNNPDPKLKTRPLQGMTFIRDFKRAETARWTSGKIYNPNNGKTYDSKLQLNPDGTLKLEGCVMVICQAQTWKRPG